MITGKDSWPAGTHEWSTFLWTHSTRTYSLVIFVPVAVPWYTRTRHPRLCAHSIGKTGSDCLVEPCSKVINMRSTFENGIIIAQQTYNTRLPWGKERLTQFTTQIQPNSRKSIDSIAPDMKYSNYLNKFVSKSCDWLVLCDESPAVMHCMSFRN